jgi:hypothetical protein
MEQTDRSAGYGAESVWALAAKFVQVLVSIFKQFPETPLHTECLCVSSRIGEFGSKIGSNLTARLARWDAASRVTVGTGRPIRNVMLTTEFEYRSVAGPYPPKSPRPSDA